MKWLTFLFKFEYYYFLAYAISILLIQRCDCLSIKPRVVDGRAAKIGQFPWQVLIKSSRDGGLRGGGSLISTDWVLTAAHCTFGLSFVVIKVGTNFVYSRMGVEMISTEIYPHPAYDPSNMHNDISLVKLPTSLKISQTVRPISLVSSKYKYKSFVGQKAILSGFGYIEDGMPNPFDDLLYAEVTIISNEKCKESYETKVFESTICSIGADGTIQSFCDGDSGGPLVMRDWNGKYVQIGVVSFSARLSCSQNYPAAYAKITSYLDFIRKVTKLVLK